MLRDRLLYLLILAMPVLVAAQGKTAYQYFRAGAAGDLVTMPQAGFALMGGGTDLDEAFRWMCERAHGGDFLILRASGDDDYNPYVEKLCKLNSVATLILPSREAASDPFVAETIAHAEAIFIAGGDQANYIRYWTGTPVQSGINAAIRRGVPVGGTSAGLAVMGEWAYSAEGDKPDDPNLSGKMALADPLGPRVTLVHGFLEIPVLKGIITDTHFAKRDRMGRLLAFLSQRRWKDSHAEIRGLGIDEGAAVLLEANGDGTVVGKGRAYRVTPGEFLDYIELGKSSFPYEFHVHRVDSGRKLRLSDKDDILPDYTLYFEHGKMTSSQRRGAFY
jgi:cyanophycinase